MFLIIHTTLDDFGQDLIWWFGMGSPYVYMHEILADFNLAVARQTTKPPDFLAIQ